MKQKVKTDFLKPWIKIFRKAIRSGNSEKIDKLIQQGNKNESYDKYRKRNLLHILAKRHCADIVTHLVKNGWDVDAEDTAGTTPLAIATLKGNALVIRTFIELGASVQKKNLLSVAPLHLACRRQKSLVTTYQIIQMLVEAGADVNAKTNDGRTPLHYAVQNRLPVYVIKYLIDKGANVNEAENNGKIPLHCAVDNLEVVELLLSTGSDIRRRDELYRTALHYAAETLNLDVIKFLEQAGANVNFYDEKKCDPLCLALLSHPGKNMTKKKIECMDYLLQQGARINRCDKDISPLYLALKSNQKVEIIRYLLIHGAVLDFKDEIVIDSMSRNVKIADFLISYATIFYFDRKDDGPLNFRTFKTTNREWEHFLDCVHELGLMRRTPIHNSLTFLNILCDRQIRPFIAYNQVLKDFKSRRTSIVFPIYNDFLHMRFYKARKYKKLEMKAKSALDRIISDLDKNAHPMIFDQIVSYLSVSDFKALIKV